jgi:hypothetical protein
MSSFLPGLSASRKSKSARKPPVPVNNHIPRDSQRERLNRIFDQYKGSLPPRLSRVLILDHSNPDDIINIEGTIQYFEAIGLDPEEPTVLALAYQLDAPSLGVFNRHGFVEGWRNLG